MIIYPLLLLVYMVPMSHLALLAGSLSVRGCTEHRVLGHGHSGEHESLPTSCCVCGTHTACSHFNVVYLARPSSHTHTINYYYVEKKILPCYNDGGSSFAIPYFIGLANNTFSCRLYHSCGSTIKVNDVTILASFPVSPPCAQLLRDL